MSSIFGPQDYEGVQGHLCLDHILKIPKNGRPIVRKSLPAESFRTAQAF